MPKTAIVGTTSWGTTLGIVLARAGVDVQLLARTDEEAKSLESARVNRRFVPGASFPDRLHVVADPKSAFEDADVVMLVVPSRSLRDNARRFGSSIDPASTVVSATKGLELATGMRMSQVLAEEILHSTGVGICALSGPNLATEIAAGKPSSTVVASPNGEAAARIQSIFNSDVFRVYTNDDIIGVELCGALKNIVALGAGICDGLGVGDNAKAAFMTRGLAEITRLGMAAGAKPATFAGLAGMGDLIATCSSTLSRNHHVGEELAKGKSIADIRATMDNVAEGVDTTPPALELADRLGVEMPIALGLHDVMFGGLSVPDAIAGLMGRAPKPE
jgi:glycerol-3-phosphate dehydrogenase (NAD(P)+)